MKCVEEGLEFIVKTNMNCCLPAMFDISNFPFVFLINIFPCCLVNTYIEII